MKPSPSGKLLLFIAVLLAAVLSLYYFISRKAEDEVLRLARGHRMTAAAVIRLSGD